MISLVGARATQIGVNHRPRMRGRSKYGFARVPKVVFDVISIKALQLFMVHRTAWIGGTATIAMLAAVANFVAWILMPPWQDSIVFLGLAILISILAVSVLFTGFLIQLIYRTGKYHPVPIFVTPTSSGPAPANDAATTSDSSHARARTDNPWIRLSSDAVALVAGSSLDSFEAMGCLSRSPTYKLLIVNY